MYDTTLPLDLSYMNQPPLRHYESEEEDISESETGHSFSPIDSSKRPGGLDSEMSLDESGMDRSVFPRLLSPFPSTGKRSRPVSMDTIKRNSSATFVTDSCTIFDHDDDMIIELPSPDSTAPLQSPLVLQPTVYVPSEPLTSPRKSSSRSSSPASFHSGDESDVCVAEQVTYVEPLAKPNIILISPTSEKSSPREKPTSPESSDGSVYSLDQAAESQPVLSETSMDRGDSGYFARPTRGKVQASLSALDTLQHCRPQRPDISEPMSATAVEAPRLMSFRARSMSFSRPPTSFTETSRRLQNDPPPCRPPSIQSTATFSLFPSAPSFNGYPRDEESRTRSTSYSHSAASSEYSISSSQPPSRTVSPSPYYSPAYNRSRSGSLYSVSSLSATPTTKRPPLPYRGSIIKGSSMLGGYSSSSLRSELENGPVEAQATEVEVEAHKSKSRHKKSLRHLKSSHSKTENPESSTTKSFVGFMLRGRRKSVIKNF